MKRNFLTAAVLGLTLAAATLPAIAAPPMFGFDFGKGRWRTICIELTDHRIRQVIADKGYTNIYLNQKNDHRIRVRGTKDGWQWLLEVSTCNGNILERRQWRPA